MPVHICTLDPARGEISFTARHMVVSKVRGRFPRWHGTLHLDDADLTRSTVEVRVEVASVDTQAADRDEYLRSAELFDVARYPELVFRSRRIEPAGRNHFRVVGDLSIRNVSKQIVLEARLVDRLKVASGGERFRFSAATALNRSEWGLTFGKALEAGGVLVSDKIEIAVAIEAVAL